MDMAPTHEVTVTFTVARPHELSDDSSQEAVERAFEEELENVGTLQVTDEDDEEQEVEVQVKIGSISWTEL